MKKISDLEKDKWIQKGFKKEQIYKCREAFDMFDLNENDYIEIDELRLALENMGHQPSEEELYRMMNEGDANGECKISFDNFMSIIYEQKMSVERKMETDIANAFRALGGDECGEEGIDLEKVKQKIREEFDMDIDMSKLIRNYNEADKKTLKFEDFMDLMSN